MLANLLLPTLECYHYAGAIDYKTLYNFIHNNPKEFITKKNLLEFDNWKKNQLIEELRINNSLEGVILKTHNYSFFRSGRVKNYHHKITFLENFIKYDAPYDFNFFCTTPRPRNANLPNKFMVSPGPLLDGVSTNGKYKKAYPSNIVCHVSEKNTSYTDKIQYLIDDQMYTFPTESALVNHQYCNKILLPSGSEYKDFLDLTKIKKISCHDSILRLNPLNCDTVLLDAGISDKHLLILDLYWLTSFYKKYTVYRSNTHESVTLLDYTVEILEILS